jgi:hypothetical protein
MAEGKPSYKKKQAYLMILVFGCLGLAVWGHSAPIAVGALLAACGIAFWASTLEPEKAPNENHHH